MQITIVLSINVKIPIVILVNSFLQIDGVAFIDDKFVWFNLRILESLKGDKTVFTSLDASRRPVKECRALLHPIVLVLLASLTCVRLVCLPWSLTAWWIALSRLRLLTNLFARRHHPSRFVFTRFHIFVKVILIDVNDLLLASLGNNKRVTSASFLHLLLFELFFSDG